MKLKTIRLLIGLLPFAVCACQAGSPFKEPPADSFSAQTHQIKVGATTTPLPGAAVAKEFFAATGAQPSLGRFFADPDYAPSAPSTVVLSQQFWTDLENASPAIIGQAIEIDGRPSIVVGIAPKGFAVPAGAAFWMPRR